MLQEAAEKLAQLGNTSEEIAAKLRIVGIKGRRQEPKSCPLTHYLVQVDPRFRNFRIGNITVYDGTLDYEAGVDMETPVRQFVRDFDDGKYPYLEEEGD